MSDSDSGESEVFDLDSDSGSDDFDPDVAKKKVSLVVPKAKAAPKPKAAPAAKAKAAPKPKKKAPLAERDENGDSDDDMDVDDDEVAPLAGPSKPKAPAKKKTASEMYEKLTPREHVLKRPDTYVGSTGIAEGPMWVYNEEDKKMTFKEIKYVPALYKIFDEILVNAADNKVRDPSMANLKVSIDVEKREISVFNDGAGIPIEMHKKEDMWIPSLIFGVLLTSSNYDDDEDKVTGGRNGYGAKLTNIYSTKFKLETGNKKAGKVFEQTWTDHMAKAGEAKIRSKSTPDFTRVTFTPDLSLFPAMENGFDADMVALFQKRVWDMAGITQGVNVYLNGEKLSGKTFGFKQYVEMFANGVNEVTGQNKKGGALAGADMAGVDAVAAKPQLIYEKFSDSWEVAFAVSDGQFQQLSYCNAIATTKGGAHVNYIADQIVAGVVDLVKKKNKNAPVKPFQIKNHISLYINCLIVNPTFNSQTKEEMTLKSSQYKDRKCKISEEFLKKVAKSGIVDNILYWAKAKQDQLMKKTDGTKRSRITGLAKLEDANNAGTRSGNKCTLILTEGDSAKSLAISGINVVGRDNYGVFPLRGKLLNVREANGKQLLENAEIQAIKQIMGLQQGKVYTSTDSLRYGSLMIMADQDHDGSHIKGLIINFLDYFFPSLLRLPDFLLEFITPIVKATKGKKTESFFTIPQYEAWKEETNNGKGWSIKYFKGLGTSTAADAKKYFSDLKLHRLPFSTLKDEERLLIDMAFNKKKADDRKEWLRGFV
ncbi:DNA topoisomerase II, partial [Pseudohyphozyma bogoriensis]